MPQLGSPPVSDRAATASLMLVSALETVTIFSSLEATKPGNDAELRLALIISLALNLLASAIAGSIYPMLGAAAIAGLLYSFYTKRQAKSDG